jgi:GT2 family glycosyltransferase
MDSRVQIVAIVVTAALFGLIFELVRRRQLMERYALLWLFSSASLLALSVWRDLLEQISALVGIAYAPSALFAIAFGFVLVLLLHFSLVISSLADQNKVLAQRVGMLQQQVDSLAEGPGIEFDATGPPPRSRPGRGARRAHLFTLTVALPPMATVVVAHDSEASLPGTLEAVRAQMRDDDELVVVDNASSDGSAAAARAAAPDARVLCLPRNDGFGAGCHAGAEITQAPLLFFLNPDARLADGCLDALRATADEQPDWGAWQALVLLEGGRAINTSGGVTHWLGIAWAGGCDRPAAEAPHTPVEVSFASGAALVVRRAAWKAVDGFDARFFMYYEDVDLALRLRLAGWRVGIVPDARVEHDYGFAKGDYKWFHLERNRWWSLITTYPTPLLVLTAPALLLFDLALLAVAARDGWLRPKLRAQAAVIAALPRLWHRRRELQAGTRIGPAGFAAALSASLDSPYLGPAAAVPGVAGVQALYWRMVRALLRTLAR